MPAEIIATWYLGDTYHTLTLHIPPDGIYFMKRKDSTGSDGVICSFTEKEAV